MRTLTILLPQILITLVTLFESTAFSAGEVGNSVDDEKPEKRSAWFLGKDRTIKYCYEIAPGFHNGASGVEAAMAQSFSTWFEYMKARRTTYEETPRLSLTTSAKALSRCDGTEDLRFLFGHQGENIDRDIRQMNFDNPLAYARRESYDLLEGWSKGYIWIATSRFNESPYLNALILHELGHVFGCSHLDGTIMTNGLTWEFSYAISYPVTGKRILTSIDHWRELVSAEGISPYSYEMWLTEFMPGENDENEAKNFEFLTGRPPVGKISSTYTVDFKENPRVLHVRDEKGEFDFPVAYTMQAVSEYENETELFKVWRLTGNSSGTTGEGYSHRSAAKVFYGSMTIKNGERIPVIVERNMGRSPVTIKRLAAEGPVLVAAVKWFFDIIPGAAH